MHRRRARNRLNFYRNVITTHTFNLPEAGEMMKRIALSAITVFFFLCGYPILATSAECLNFSKEIFKDTRYTEEKYYKAERVLLSATKKLMDARKAPAINTVITAEEIRNMGARNLFDILNRLPGVTTSWNQIKGLINMRGVQTDHSEKILLLIDGISINDSCTGSPAFLFGEDMMVENIKRIEIVRGPGSALFGANAFIGVINIITKTPDDYEKNEIYISHGSFDTNSHTFFLSHKKSDLKISGHFNYYDTEGERPYIASDRIGNSGHALTFDEKYDYGIKLVFKDLSVNSRIIDKNRGDFLGALGALDDNSNYDFFINISDVSFTKNLTDDLGLGFDISNSYIDYEAFNTMLPKGYTGGDDKGMIGVPIYKNNTINAQITANYRIGDHFLTSGIVFENDRQYHVRHITNFDNTLLEPRDATDTLSYNKNITRNMGAVFLQEIWEISAYDTLTLGIRYDHYDDFGGSTNPRAGYVHEFKNEMIVKLLYGQAFRAPSYNELYTVNNPGVAGNENLDPETIETFEAAVEIPFLKYFNLNVSYFYNTIDDLIRIDATSPKDPPPFDNVSDESTIQGVETELTFELGKNSYGFINASYQDSQDMDGNKLPYVAEWMANAGYNHEFFRILNANINVSWIGERSRSSVETRDAPGPSTLVDITLIARNFYQSLEIRGSVYNIFDKNFIAPTNRSELNYDYPLHKRMVLVEMLYKF